jgi:hypothetical protein
MTEIMPKTAHAITPTSVATSLGTPDPTIATSTVTRGRETISRNNRSALTLDIPEVIVIFMSPDAASVLAHTKFDPRLLDCRTPRTKRDATDVVGNSPRKRAENNRAAPENCTLD